MSAIFVDTPMLERWAAFSGDYNPIHFDREAARRLGAADVVVHGMIPVTLAMQAADAALVQPGSGWRQCRVRLKRPLLKERTAQLVLKREPQRVKFTVGDGDQEGHYLAGVLARGDEPERRAERTSDRRVSLAPFTLAQARVAGQAQRFGELFPRADTSWLALSAILFAQVVTGQLSALEADSRRWAGWPAGAAVPLTTLQTSYAVNADEAYFGARTVAALEAVSCRYEPASVFAVEGGFMGECWLRACVGNRCVMEIGVGLLVRIASVAAA